MQPHLAHAGFPDRHTSQEQELVEESMAHGSDRDVCEVDVEKRAMPLEDEKDNEVLKSCGLMAMFDKSKEKIPVTTRDLDNSTKDTSALQLAKSLALHCLDSEWVLTPLPGAEKSMNHSLGERERLSQWKDGVAIEKPTTSVEKPTTSDSAGVILCNGHAVPPKNGVS